MSAFLQEQGIFVIRLLLACICGGMIGLERQQRTKFAGIRTHIIICMAASLMMLISKYGFHDVVHQGINYDVSRVAAGIIAGMGILGGGVVISNKQGTVSGITTAAGIWVTIAIGMAIGAGMYVLGVIATLMVEIIQSILHMNFTFVRQHMRVNLTFQLGPDSERYQALTKDMEKAGIQITNLKWDRRNRTDWIMKCQVNVPVTMNRDEVIQVFSTYDELESIEIM